MPHEEIRLSHENILVRTISSSKGMNSCIWLLNRHIMQINRSYIFIAATLLLVACQHKKTAHQVTKTSSAVSNIKPFHFSRFLMFRVYTYPQYEISVYDPAEDADLSLEQWRKKQHE